MEENSLSAEEQDQLNRSIKKARKVRIRPRVGEVGQSNSEKENSGGMQDGGKRKFSYREMVMGGSTSDQEAGDGCPIEEEGSDDDEESCGSDDVQFSKEQWRKFRTPWRSTLRIKVLGKQFGYQFLLRRLVSIWRPKGELKLISLSNNFFIVKLELTEDRERILLEGPWKILDYYLAVRTWTPNFRASKASIEWAALWVRIPDCPMELCNEEGMKGIGDFIGKTLKIDLKTQSGEMGNFARVCVEVDLTKKLRSDFTILGERFGIQYEGIHLVCFNCGIYGHKLEECPLRCNVGPLDKEQPDEDQNCRSNKVDDHSEDDVSIPIEERPSLQPTKGPDPSPGHGPWILGGNSRRRSGKSSRFGSGRGRGLTYDKNFTKIQGEPLGSGVKHIEEMGLGDSISLAADGGLSRSNNLSIDRDTNRGKGGWSFKGKDGDPGMDVSFQDYSHSRPYQDIMTQGVAVNPLG